MANSPHLKRGRFTKAQKAETFKEFEKPGNPVICGGENQTKGV